MNSNKYIPPFDCDFYGKEFPHNQNLGEQRFIQSDGKTFSDYRPPPAVNLNSEQQFVIFEANSYPGGGFGLAFPQNQQTAHCLVPGNEQSLGEQRNSYAINLTNGPYTSSAVNYSASNVNGINLTCQQHLQQHNVVHEGAVPVCPDNRNSGVSKKEKQPRKKNTGDRPFHCDECDKTFGSEEGQRIHMVCHSEERRFECDFCGKKFLRKQQMQHHRLIHTGEKPYVCEVCHKGFPIMKRLRIHMRAHSDERPFPCDKCDKKFKSMTAVRVHMKYHEDDKPHVCEFCPMKFKKASNLTRHQRIHSGVKPYHCKMCPMRYSNRESFLKHVRSHDGQSKSQTSDSNPDAVPAEKDPRKILKIVTQKPHLCVFCREEFPDQGELEKHKLYHKREKPFPCFVCGARFFRSPNLKIHLSVIHAEGSDQKDLKLKRLYGVKSKEKRLPNKKKRFTCQLCNKIFLFKIHLQSHFKSHLRERGLLYKQGEFACDKCGKRFHKKSNLRIHSFVHSNKKKPLKCKVCSRSFIDKSLLSKHMQVHTAEKSYVCPVCQNQYGGRYTLMRHCRKQHPDYDLRKNSQTVEESSDSSEDTSSDTSSDSSDDENIALGDLQKKITKDN